jgi:hypothetical protein
MFCIMTHFRASEYGVYLHEVCTGHSVLTLDEAGLIAAAVHICPTAQESHTQGN